MTGNGAFQQCVYIGQGASPNGQGEWRRSVGIGYLANVTASNQFVFGSTLVTEIGAYEPWSNLSDGRFKRNIEKNVPGLDFINALEPITYTVDALAVEKFTRTDKNFQEFKRENMEDLQRASERVESGFIAQDVEEAAKKLGYDFNGIVTPENEKDPYAIAYSQFVVPLVSAVQELDEKNKSLEKQNQQQNEEIELLRLEIEKIKKLIND